MKRLLFLSVLLLAAACRSGDPKQPESSAPSASEATALDAATASTDEADAAAMRAFQLRIDSLVYYGNTFGETREAITEQLGPPARVDAREVANPHDGSADRWITLVYPGLEFGIYHVLQADKEFLQHVVMTQQPPDVRLPIAPGMARADVVQLLGPTFVLDVGDDGRETPATVIYQRANASWEGDRVRLRFDADDRLEAILWWFGI